MGQSAAYQRATQALLQAFARNMALKAATFSARQASDF